MNCSDFLPALETGGFWRRRAARRHAGRCPDCARTLASWQALKPGLAAVAPLPDRQRDLWTSVAHPLEVRPRTNYWRRAAAVAVAAALLFFAIFWSVRDRNLPPREDRMAEHHAAEVVVAAISRDRVAEELAPLEQRLDRMETEVAELSQRAELADLRRQTATLLENYRHW
jgi:hypothetical protein